MKLRLSLALCATLAVAPGCAHQSVTLDNAAGVAWPRLDASAKSRIAKACILEQANAPSLPPRARQAVRESDPEALVARLNLYYRDARPQSDPVTQACRIVIEQRYAPSIRITKLLPGQVLPAAERFLRIEGTVTAGAAVHLQGGERSMPAFVSGNRFQGSIEVSPGRHPIYATARFPGSMANSRPILVMRRRSAQNLRREGLEEASEDSRDKQAREMKAARERAAKK
jgi:hypothetical protein